MTREEVESYIVNTLFECTHSGEDDTISDKEFAKVLADKFIDYETDLLKEFVEWLKEKCKDIYQLYNEEMQEETDRDNSTWFIGRKDGIGEIRQMLKTAVERFLEERK